ncbi:lipoprotein [Acrocarpospora corrugata]|uniref:Lipoprotein n=2 Tax=Acrocarpospora corrugata TaxID=35763 RepID=A0A5M3VTG9_9ACTN|nr:lipoprotein [Acrocarpospora corrugata]
MRPTPGRAARGLGYLLVPLTVSAFLAAGCGGAEMGGSTAAPAMSSENEAAMGGVAQDSAAAKMAPSQAPEGESADQSRRAVGNSGPVQPINIQTVDRSIIYTAELTVQAKDVGKASDSAKQLVLGAGGYVSDEKSNAFSGSNSEAMITFKIPPARYAEVLVKLGTDLGERRSLHQGAQDVTGEVADVAARVKSAESALDQFRLLLTKADKIGEILEIEREIQNRTAELESLQARQKALAEQTGMATVTLTLVGPSVVIETPQEEPSGFFGGLEVGWNALVKAVEIGLTLLGTLLPWLILIVLMWVIVQQILRRVRPRQTAPAVTVQEKAPEPKDDAPVGSTSES